MHTRCTKVDLSNTTGIEISRAWIIKEKNSRKQICQKSDNLFSHRGCPKFDIYFCKESGELHLMNENW